MKLEPKQLVVGPYLWHARVRSNKNGAGSGKITEFINSSIGLGVPNPGRHGYVSDLRNEAQTIMSRENPIHLLGRKHHPEEIGGNFESYKVEIIPDSWNPETFSNTTTTQPSYETVIPVGANEVSMIHQMINGSGGVDYKDQTALTAWVKGKTPTPLDIPAMDTWGTQVIASVIPTNPVADLSTTLAELASEGKFFENPLKDSATTSDRYLNYQFGIAPSVGFAKDLRKAVSNRDAIINQYERDAGKRVRRKFDVPPDKTVTKTTRSLASLYGLGLGALSTRVASTGTCTVTTTTTKWKSFSGCFTYYLPKRGFMSELDRLDKLYGVNPLDNLKGIGWELTPYSWLVDYFSSAGAYNKNLDAFAGDSLVMPYAYVMFTTVKDVEYSWTGLVRKGSAQVLRTFGGRVKTTSMQRRQATPYGFGLSDSDLTTKQWSILAALGIGRASKWL